MYKILFFLCCLLGSISGYAQFDDCDVGSVHNCTTSYTLDVVSGENITQKLKDALDNNCEVRIPGNGTGQGPIYYITPTVFSGDAANPNTAIRNKRIILEAGITLQSIVGGFNYCSQSMFTFDGSGNENISIIGEHVDCEFRPILRMPETVYEAQEDMGYLVASDNVGEPYLNGSGDPNFVYDDGDSDPYFDNFGNPNLITNPLTQFPVPASCDTNYYLCNRRIIVWCPLAWEGRHVIAVHGASNMTITGVSVDWSAGGDGIVLASDEFGTPSEDILIKDVHFIRNARTGVDIVNANCIEVDECYFEGTGDQVGLQTYVEVRGGVAFQSNPNQGLPSSMDSIELSKSSFYRNENSGVKVHIPSVVVDPVELLLDRLCIDSSKIGLLMDTTLSNSEGLIELNNISVSSTDIGLYFTERWQSNGVNAIDVDANNLDLSASSNLFDHVIEPLSTICGHFSGSDVCLGNSNTICGLSFVCNSTNNSICAENSASGCIPPPCDPCVYTKYDTICTGDEITLEAAIDIPDILAERPLANNGWNNQLEIDNCCLDGDVELCFTLTSQTGRTIQGIGLDADPHPSAHINTIDYALRIQKNAGTSYRVRVYENGAFKKNVNYSYDLVGSTFCVKRTGNDVTYFVNGVEIYESLIDSEGPLCFDNSFYSTTNQNSVWYGGISEFSNITYKVTGGVPITWIPSGSGPSITVSPIVSTTYTAIFPIGDDGCYNYVVHDVTVLETPDMECAIWDDGDQYIVADCAYTKCEEDCITLEVFSNTMPSSSFTYAWENAAGDPLGTNPSIDDVCDPGIYTVTVTNEDGCTQVKTFEITDNPTPDASAENSGVLTCTNTFVTVFTDPGYCYEWSNGQTVASFQVTQPGIYCVTVTDCITGCSLVDCTEVLQNITYPTVNLSKDGDITCSSTSVEVCTTSDPDYTYDWSNGASTACFNTSTAGTYCVTVTDVTNGCTTTGCIDVTGSTTPPVVDLEKDGDLTCTNLSVEVCTTSDPNYTYSWSNGGNNACISVSTAGTYCVTVTDDTNGCTSTGCIEVIEDLTVPTINLTEDGPLDCINTSVQVCTTSDPDYSYSWSNGGNTACISVSTPDTYCVTVTDDTNGCTSTECIVVTEDDGVVVDLVNSCLVGTITITTTLDPDYSYEWSTGGTTNEVQVMGAGQYCVTVTNNTNGCTDTDCVTVTQEDIDACVCEGSTIGAGADMDETFDFPGISEGNNLCWTFNPFGAPDGLTITIGGVPILVTGPVTTGTGSSTCAGIVQLGDLDAGDCVPLAMGVGTVASNGALSGSFQITAAQALLPIQLLVDANACGGTGTLWNINISCCEDLSPCDSIPMNLDCQTTDNATHLVWDPLPFATGYNIIVDQDSDCCPTGDPNFVPMNINVGNTTAFTVPSFFPNCYSWSIQTIDGNGQTSNFSDPMCMDGTQNCTQIPEVEPCDPIEPPEVDCNEDEFGDVTLTWEPVQDAVMYNVIVTVGPDACCPDATEPGVFIYQITDNQIVLDHDIPECFSYVVESICGDFTSSSTESICVSELSPCGQTYGCQQTPEGGLVLVWDEIPIATGYNIMISQDSECCEDPDPDFVPFTVNVTDPTSFVVPANFPECFTWSIQTIGENGETSPFTPGMCINDESECEEIPDPDPCEEVGTPTDIICGTSEEGNIVLGWEGSSEALVYNVMISFGPNECCPEGTESGRRIFQVTDPFVVLPEDIGSCFTYRIQAICGDFVTSSASEIICMNEEMPCGDGEGKKRGQQLTEHLNKQSLQVHPNPVKDLLHVNLNSDLSGTGKVRLYHSNGVLAQTEMVEMIQGKNKFVLSMNQLHPGLYILKVQIGNEEFIERVIVME